MLSRHAATVAVAATATAAAAAPAAASAAARGLLAELRCMLPTPCKLPLTMSGFPLGFPLTTAGLLPSALQSHSERSEAVSWSALCGFAKQLLDHKLLPPWVFPSSVQLLSLPPLHH